MLNFYIIGKIPIKVFSIINNESDWLLKYNFIMDRLRSVRQDMVIQNISRAHQIVILQPIIRFHAYAAYRYVLVDIEVSFCLKTIII